MVDDYRYIENMPVSYSFYNNKITAVMGNKNMSFGFITNIILQLLTFYSYEDLKIVVFTNEENDAKWDYLKFLNHNFSNDKGFRFFASDNDSIREVSDYLNRQYIKLGHFIITLILSYLIIKRKRKMNTLVILQETAQAGGNMSFLIMMVLIFAVMYFFMIRPQQKKQKEIAKWRESIQKGDKVVTVGGIYGVVAEVKPTYILMEVDSSVKIKVDKGYIVKDVTDIPVK